MGILGNNLLVNKDVARRVGLRAAVLLGELCSRQVQHGPGFCATSKQLEDSTTMSAHEIQRAAKELSAAGIVSVEKRGVPARNHYAVNEGAILSLFENAENY